MTADTARRRKGTFADDFIQRMNVSDSDATHITEALQMAAKGLAAQWATASYQEQLDTYATLVQKKRDSQGSRCPPCRIAIDPVGSVPLPPAGAEL